MAKKLDLRELSQRTGEPEDRLAARARRGLIRPELLDGYDIRAHTAHSTCSSAWLNHR